MQSTPLDNSFSTKPEVGLDLRIKNGLIIFSYRAINYVIRSHPDEPCTYIGRGEENLHTLHSGFKTCDIEKMILKDKQFVSVDKRLIGRDALLQIFAAVIDDGRKEMGFDEADVLFCYQISRVVYDFLIAKSLPHRIPNPPVPPSVTNRYHNIFLCSESAYAKRNEFTLKDVDLSLCDDCPIE